MKNIKALQKKYYKGQLLIADAYLRESLNKKNKIDVCIFSDKGFGYDNDLIVTPTHYSRVFEEIGTGLNIPCVTLAPTDLDENIATLVKGEPSFKHNIRTFLYFEQFGIPLSDFANVFLYGPRKFKVFPQYPPNLQEVTDLRIIRKYLEENYRRYPGFENHLRLNNNKPYVKEEFFDIKSRQEKIITIDEAYEEALNLLKTNKR